MRLSLSLVFLLGAGIELQAQANGHCQQSCLDSTVYRPGKWGVDFVATQDVPTLGVFRLVSARTAWIADLSGSVRRTPADNPVSPGQTRPDVHITVADGAIGLRRYRALATQSVALFGIGAAVDWTRVKVDGIDESLGTLVGGPYLEGGAQYHVVPHVALGFQLRLRALTGYTRVGQIDFNGAVTTESKRESLVELTPVRLTLSIMF